MSASPLLSFVVDVRTDARRERRVTEADNGSTQDAGMAGPVVPAPMPVARMRNGAAALARASCLAFADAGHGLLVACRLSGSRLPLPGLRTVAVVTLLRCAALLRMSLVVVTYANARALALVVRMSHGIRKRG